MMNFCGNRCVLLILVSFFSQVTFSQLSFKSGITEAGITFSPSNFLGDLGGSAGKGGAFLKDNNIYNTKLLISAQVSVYPYKWLGVRLSLTHGTIAGDDAYIKSNGGVEEARKARNQSFKSKINEALICAEMFPTVFLEEEPANLFHKIRPYFLLGIGVFHFRPLGQDPVTGEWISLKELHTEGQGFPEYPERKNYKLVQMDVPVGFGIKYYLNDKLCISAEFLHRVTFTDYLDDVSTTYIDNNLFYKNLPPATAIVADRMHDKSVGFANRNAGDQRGSPAHNDSFYSTGIKISFRLGADSDNKNVIRCPVVKL